MPLLPKCHIPHSLSQTTFFSRPAAHPFKIRKQNRLAKFKKKRNHTNSTPKASKKAIPRPTPTKFQKQTPQKDIPKQSIKPHQLENTPTQTAIQIHPTSAQTPLKTHTPQNASTFSPKRKCISLQTPKSLLPNAKAFHLKRKDVCPQTQARFPPQNLPIIPHPASPNAPKSLKTRRTCLQIPPNLSISHPSHPLQKPSERDTLLQISIKFLRIRNQKVTKTTAQAAKRNQTAQIGINPEIRYKASDSPRSKPLFFPIPILQNARKSLLVP